MVGPTAQLVALTCHFNAICSGVAAEPFFPDNSTCTFCEYVRFTEPKRRWFSTAPTWNVVATSPDDWFSNECREGRRAFLIHRSINEHHDSPDRLSAGFVGGGGQWFMAVRAGERFHHWESKWEV